MDLMRTRVALRERALLDVLDLAIRFCAAHAGAYARLSLAVLLPAFVASFALARAGGWWLGWAAVLTITAFVDVPFVALASRLVFADEVRIRAALSVALRATPRLLGVRVVQLLALAGSVLLSGLPWLWVGTIQLFVVEVILLEQAKVVAALGRAQRIANAHFGAALMATILLLAAPWASAALTDLAGRELLQAVLEVKPPPSMFAEGGSWLALLGWWAALPLLATARFFVYLDVRTRTEGWDIQTRFAAIAARRLEPEAGGLR
jgi:hypothetical protein